MSNIIRCINAEWYRFQISVARGRLSSPIEAHEAHVEVHGEVMAKCMAKCMAQSEVIASGFRISTSRTLVRMPPGLSLIIGDGIPPAQSTIFLAKNHFLPSSFSLRQAVN
ncbi:hypothetical protein [Paenibacillus thiaminolyticus]|uniref:hypothetical protein n=1 Tax=Paenibacillus thiaminolyticus TaxID=49283 RepID=UPI0011C3A1B2|nr:hypothetical protein [Paenibacillus thiaminolyticus]